MHFKISVFAFLLASFSYAQLFQSFDSWNKNEKNIIKNSSELMRVLNLSNEKDAIILKSKSKPVNPRNKTTRLLAEKMIKTVQNPDHRGVGIAAPQVGINRRMIVVQRLDKPTRPFEIFINPEIVWKSDLFQKGFEGDLSFEERKEIYRNYIIQIKYQDLKGKIHTEILENFTAVIFQHERDHLDGVLLTDRWKEQVNQPWSDAKQTQELYFNYNVNL